MADRQETTVSATGIWVDLATGHVVESQPEAGKLIVPPGGEIDQRALDDIAAAKLAAGQTDVEPDTEEQAPADPAAKPRPTARKAQAKKASATPRRGRGVQKAAVADTTEKATE